MAVSIRYKQLRARVAELKKHLLPNRFSPTGDYTDRQMDRARGYRILVHAEIESYIEDSVNEIIDLAQTQFIKIVKENHGVRENNLKSLILPIGVDISELDHTWLTGLDNFGSLRGEIAHNAKRTTDQINPKDEYNNVLALLEGLKSLDTLILKQKQTASV